MIVNRELLAKLKEARKSLSPERSTELDAAVARYERACQLSLGPDAARSEHWDNRAAEEKVILYGFLRKEEKAELPGIDPTAENTEVIVTGGHSWY